MAPTDGVSSKEATLATFQEKIDAKTAERDALIGKPDKAPEDTGKIEQLTAEIVALCEEREKSR